MYEHIRNFVEENYLLKVNSWLANKKIIRRSFTKDMNGRVQKSACGRLNKSADWKTRGQLILLQKYY